MKGDLQFDFLVDKEKNTMTIRREFKANRHMEEGMNSTLERLDDLLIELKK